MIIAFDWDGVFAKNDVVNEATKRRFKQLNMDVTKEYVRQAQRTLSHYAVLRDVIGKYTGIQDTRKVTKIMVNLFVLHYTAVFHELREKGLHLDFVHAFQQAKQKHKINCALITSLAASVLDPVLDMLDLRGLFTYIKANTDDLQLTKEEQLRQLMNETKEDVALMVGDRKQDLEAGKAVGAKTAFVTWGYGKKEECEALADYILESPADLDVIIDSLF